LGTAKRSIALELNLSTAVFVENILPDKDQSDAMAEKQLPDPEIQIRLATFDHYRSFLFSVAYRMLGSVADAEDMLQETFIRWQQAPMKEIQSPRAFLITIISRLCINHLQSARVQREEYFGEWLPEPIVTGFEGDPLELVRVDESLSMAFLVLLERLTPVERAVFLLREIFEYEYSEIASALGYSEVNCRQILRRARQHVAAMRPRFTTTQSKKREMLEGFLEATSSGDMEALLAILAKDVVLHSDGGNKGLAVPNLIEGAGNVARGILGSLQKLVPVGLVTRVEQINGEPGVISYRNGSPYSVLTFSTGGDRIRAIYVLTNPSKLKHLPDLPATAR
jgi:RNA polymerase sigma-70 factor, ECF subfamily